MDSVKKLEVIVASWYKDMPHLPIKGQKWLADNIWWLTLIGVIVGVIGAFQVLVATFFVGALVGGMVGGLYGGAVLGGLALFTVALTLALALLSLVVSALAISPLHAMQKKGWLLLFITLLIGVLSTVIGFVLQWNIGGFIAGIIFAAIGGYFLYEIRSYFGKVHVSKKA
jgi:uncharacterized membrane protein YhaH (DUF805 family)